MSNSSVESNEGIKRLKLLVMLIWMAIGAYLSFGILTSSVPPDSLKQGNFSPSDMGILLALVNMAAFIFGPLAPERISGKVVGVLAGPLFYFGAIPAVSAWYPTYYEATIYWIGGVAFLLVILLIRWVIDGFISKRPQQMEPHKAAGATNSGEPS